MQHLAQPKVLNDCRKGTKAGSPCQRNRPYIFVTKDLGYPSAIAVLWFIIILVFIAIMTRLLRQRDRLEF